MNYQTASDMDLKQSVELYLSTVGKKKTRHRYSQSLSHLVQRFGERKITDISRIDMEIWRATICGQALKYANSPVRKPVEGPLSIATQWTILDAARRFFRWLAELGIIENSPATHLKKPPGKSRPDKAISESHLEKLLRSAQAHSARDFAIGCLLLSSAARAGDIITLKIEDLHLDVSRAYVDGKGGVRRPLFIGNRAVEAIRVWLSERPTPYSEEDPVFCTYRGKPLTYWGLRQIIRRTAKRAGIKGRSNLHGYRHAAIIGGIRQGADLKTMKEIAGHSNIKTTEIYAGMDEEEVSERHRRFDPLERILPQQRSEKPHRRWVVKSR